MPDKSGHDCKRDIELLMRGMRQLLRAVPGSDSLIVEITERVRVKPTPKRKKRRSPIIGNGAFASEVGDHRWPQKIPK